MLPPLRRSGDPGGHARIKCLDVGHAVKMGEKPARRRFQNEHFRAAFRAGNGERHFEQPVLGNLGRAVGTSISSFWERKRSYGSRVRARFSSASM
jgi:hypothetical protein